MQCFIFAASFEGNVYLESLDAPDFETARRDALHRAVGFFTLEHEDLVNEDEIEALLGGFAISTLEGLTA